MHRFMSSFNLKQRHPFLVLAGGSDDFYETRETRVTRRKRRNRRKTMETRVRVRHYNCYFASSLFCINVRVIVCAAEPVSLVVALVALVVAQDQVL